MFPLAHKILIFPILAGIVLIIGATDDEANSVQPPPFPDLINVLDPESYRIHIISESIDDIIGYHTTEEFLDLKLLRDTFVTKDKNGQSVVHIDGRQELMYLYKPYTCQATTINSGDTSYSTLWTTRFTFSSGSTIKYMTTYGVASIWINASNRPRQYELAKGVFSNALNKFSEAHKWTITDSESNQLVHLYFSEVGKMSDGQARLALERIQVESIALQKVVRTINILVADNIISEEVYENLLQVPVGYGCHDVETAEKSRFKFPKIKEFKSIFHDSHRYELEMTSTKYFDVNEDGQVQRKRLSDTMSIILVRTNAKGEDNMQLVRQRHSSQDTKLVLNYFLNIQYRIDFKKGSCEMKNMGATVDGSERVTIRFPLNNLELNMDLEMMDELFLTREGFFYIKRVESKGKEQLVSFYYEKTSTKLIPNKNVRIIRVFIGVKSSDTGKVNAFKLDSVIVKVFDEELTKVTESYHINVMDVALFYGDLSLAKVFDVSEECYLNNELMRSGRDYTWSKFEYSLGPSLRFSETLASNADSLKATIYALLKTRGIDFFNAPRLEIVFGEDSMQVRMLLLDLPPIKLLYESRPNTMLQLDKSRGDLEELTQDLDHCADLCRLNKCKAMTFCDSNYVCLLAQDFPDTQNSRRKLIEGDCNSLVQPKSLTTTTTTTTSSFNESDPIVIDDIFQLSLYRILADFQHADYDNMLIPKMPKALAMPGDDTDLDSDAKSKLGEIYLREASNFLKEEGQRLPLLSFLANLPSASVLLVPDKFEVEDDPLTELDVTDRRPSLSFDDDAEGFETTTQAFHEGRSLYRYRISALEAAAKEQPPEGDQKKPKAKLFSGLSYDQCALACIDGACSTFSYCTQRRECIVTNIWDIGSEVSSMFIEQDLDCFIAQRDFLSKFNKFAAVAKPTLYKKYATAFNPSECAHSCVVEADFNCLAFDFCQATDSQPATCLYRQERFIFTGADASTRENVKQAQRVEEQTCDHYSRSYLADFVRIEHRQLTREASEELSQNLLEGYSVDQCADMCANKFESCSAFQFCLDIHEEYSRIEPRTAIQKCHLLESKQPNEVVSNQVVVDSTSGNLIKTSAMLEPSDNCHVFALRKNSQEAQLRALALDATTTDQEIATDAVSASSSGLTFLGGFFLLASMIVIFAGLGFTIVIASNRNRYIRRQFKQLRTLIRLESL